MDLDKRLNHRDTETQRRQEKINKYRQSMGACVDLLPGLRYVCSEGLCAILISSGFVFSRSMFIKKLCG